MISDVINKSSQKTLIHDQVVEIVPKYKYLGTVFDEKLNWNDNTDAIMKKGQQRLYFLRKLNSFSVDKIILTPFYKSFIESILTFSFRNAWKRLSDWGQRSLVKSREACQLQLEFQLLP